MAFGYETCHNAIKHDYVKQSLVLHQKKKKNMQLKIHSDYNAFLMELPSILISC